MRTRASKHAAYDLLGVIAVANPLRNVPFDGGPHVADEPVKVLQAGFVYLQLHQSLGSLYDGMWRIVQVGYGRVGPMASVGTNLRRKWMVGSGWWIVPDGDRR